MVALELRPRAGYILVDASYFDHGWFHSGASIEVNTQRGHYRLIQFGRDAKICTRLWSEQAATLNARKPVAPARLSGADPRGINQVSTFRNMWGLAVVAGPFR